MRVELPEQSTPSTSQPQSVRVVHVSVQPKSWLGRLAVAIVGAAAMVVAFFLSIIALAVVAGLVAAAVIYLLWTTRRIRRAMREQVIEGEVESRDIH
jgi:O-antigen/teichoic acid export membrane protein